MHTKTVSQEKAIPQSSQEEAAVKTNETFNSGFAKKKAEPKSRKESFDQGEPPAGKTKPRSKPSLLTQIWQSQYSRLRIIGEAILHLLLDALFLIAWAVIYSGVGHLLEMVCPTGSEGVLFWACHYCLIVPIFLAVVALIITDIFNIVKAAIRKLGRPKK